MSENSESEGEMKKNHERETAGLERKRQEKDEKDRNERAEEDQRRRDEEAAEEERKRRAAAAEAIRRQAAAAEAARAREAAMQQQQKMAEQQKQNMSEKSKIVHGSNNAKYESNVVTFSPEPPQLQQLDKGGRKPRPEPDFIKLFKNSLKDDDAKKSVNYDHETGQLNFSGEKGLNALVKFLEANPNVKITLVTDRVSKDTLRALRDHTLNDGTNLLDKLSGITLNGKSIQGHEMRKMIQDKIGSPRPSINNGSGGNFQ